MNRCTISCELHDYIEIACLYGYRLRLKLKDNDAIEGKAIDIINEDKREYLLIDCGRKQRIDLTQLVKIQVLTPNAKFNEVIF